MVQFIDEHVGKRIRQRRLSLGLSEKSVGKDLSRTVLEIKRYELGLDVVEASTLFELATALDVPVAYFFRGLEIVPVMQNSELNEYSSA